MKTGRVLLLASLSFVPLVVAAACSATGSGNTAGNGGNGGSGNGGNGGTGNGIGNFGGTGGVNLGDANCGSKTFANQVPGSILVVLDRSGSMSGGNGSPDKWGPTVDALKSMMMQADPALEMGLLPFSAGDFDDSGLALCGLNPSSPQCAALFADGGCTDVHDVPDVPVGPLSMTESQIAGWLDANGPQGNTPTLWALKKGYAYLDGYAAQGEKYVLLMTDGEPNVYTPAMSIGGFSFPESNIECKTEADIEAEALAAAQNLGIKTFVIGAPGSEAGADFLSQVALNGGTAKANCNPASGDCHYQIGQASFQTDLEAVLNEIAGKISDCVFEIPAGNEMVDPNFVNVVVETPAGSEQLYKDTSHMDGWDYGNAAQTQIVLYGPACEAFKSGEGNSVSIVLGCQTITK